MPPIGRSKTQGINTGMPTLQTSQTAPSLHSTNSVSLKGWKQRSNVPDISNLSTDEQIKLAKAKMASRSQAKIQQNKSRDKLMKNAEQHLQRSEQIRKREREEKHRGRETKVSKSTFRSSSDTTLDDRGTKMNTPELIMAKKLLAKDWGPITEYDPAIQMFVEEKNRRIVNQRFHENQHVVLLQRTANKKREADQKQELRNFQLYLENDAAKYKKEEEDKRLNKLKIDYEEKNLRDRQLANLNRLRDAEAKRDKAEVDKMMDAARKSIEAETQKTNAKKEKMQGIAGDMKKESEAAVKFKAEQKIREGKEDQKLMAIQREMMDEQERKRKNYFENLKGKAGKNQEMYEKLVGEAAARRKEEEETNCKNATEKHNKEIKEAAEKKEKYLAELQTQCTKAIDKQLDFQKKERDRLTEEDQQISRVNLADANKYKDEEKQKEIRKKKEAMENSKFLKYQMNEYKPGYIPPLGRIDPRSQVQSPVNQDHLRRAKEKLIKVALAELNVSPGRGGKYGPI